MEEASATRNTGPKTVIDILSDDSDDSLLAIDFRGDGDLELTNVDEQPPGSSLAILNEIGPSSPPATAPAASPCLSQQSPSSKYHSSRSRIETQDSSSGEEDLRQILKAARKAKAQKASEEQVIPVPTPDFVIPPAPFLSDLSAGNQALFGGQVKSIGNFFSPEQTQSSTVQTKDGPKDKTPDGTNASSKRKAPYDPFAVHLLNIESHDSTRARKKKRRDKTREHSRTSSQLSHVNLLPQVSGHASTIMASQGLMDQRPGASGFEQTPRAGIASSRRESLVSNAIIRHRAASAEPLETSPDKSRSNFNQLVAPRKRESTTLLAIPDRRQFGCNTDETEPRRRNIVNVDEDDDPVQPSGASQVQAATVTQTAGAASRRRSNSISRARSRNRSGSGIHSRITHCHRSPTTQQRPRNASRAVSQEPSDDFQGYVGGRPEKRPAYARREANSWDKVVKRAKNLQVGFSSRVGRRTAVIKQKLQQLPLSSNPREKARLLRAQEGSNWREAVTPSAQTASLNGSARSSPLRSHCVTGTHRQPLFRPDKSAWYPTTFEDDDEGDGDQSVTEAQPQPLSRPKGNPYLPANCENDADDDGTAGSTLHSAMVNGTQAHPTATPQAQPAYNNDNRTAGSQRTALVTSAPKTPLQGQPQALDMPLGMLNPRRPQDPTQMPKVTGEDWDRIEASMIACRNKYEGQPQATVVDSLPSGFGMSEPLEVRRARENLARGKAKFNSKLDIERISANKRFNNRKSAIRRKVQKDFPNESKEAQEAETQRRFAAYREKQQAKSRQATDDTYVPSATFNVAFLESGHRDDEVHDGQDVDPDAKRVSAHKALKTLGSNTSIDKYTVMLSGPCSEGKDPKFYATKAFGLLDKANQYAHSILYDLTPPNTSLQNHRNNHRAFSDVMSVHKDGLFSGQGKVSSGRDAGKLVMIFVHKEAQLAGDLTPDAMRNRYVDKELLAKYTRYMYQAFMISAIPKCYREAEAEVEKKKLALRKRQERQELRREQKREQGMKKRAEESAERGDEVPTGLEGDELRRELAKLGPPGTLRLETDEVTAADEEESYSDTASQASVISTLSRGTIRASSPAGDSYDRDPQNAYADLYHDITLLGSFTNLCAANQTAINAARIAWKPRDRSIYAGTIWLNEVLPLLEAQDPLVDDQQVHLVFPGFESGYTPGYRPWGFTHSQVFVLKVELQGPVDLALDFEQDIYDGGKDAEEAEPPAAAEAEAEVDGEELRPEVDELLDEDAPDRRSLDEEIFSEED